MAKNIQSSVAFSLEKLPGVSTFEWDTKSDHAVLSVGAQALLGVSGPISTDDFCALVHPDDRIRFQAEVTAHMETGGDVTREFRILRADGSVRHILSHAMLKFEPETGQGSTTGIFIDVTASRVKRAEEDMSERHLGSYDFDVKTGVSVWSPTLNQMFMCPTEAPVPLETIHRQIHPDDRERVMAWIEVALRTPGPYEMSFCIVLPDGKVLRVRDKGEAHPPIDPETGRVARTTGTLTDITRQSNRTDARKLARDEFWQLIDTAPIGAYAVDADLRISRISRTALAAFSEIENLMGRDLDELLHILWPEPFASEAVARFRHTLATGEPYYGDPVIEDRADRGVLEAYDWSVERIEMEDGRFGVLCYFYDLSDRVRSERALEEQKRRLSLAYDAARMGAWEVDLATGKAEGTPQLSVMVGESVVGGNVAEVWQRAIHPDDKHAVDSAFITSIENGSPFDVDFRILTPKGEIRYLASRGEVMPGPDGRPARIIGVNQDITVRKTTELALLQSEMRLRTVLNKTLAFVGVLGPAGNLREANQPALDFAGLTRDAVIGKPFWETFWWTHSEEVSQICRNSVREGQAGRSARCDIIVRGKDDHLITIDFLLAPVLDDRGQVEMLVASGFDISAREEARTREKALMGEINHRTKNILTLVQAVARQTARSGPVDFLPRFEARLGALARAQDLLFQSNADRVDLRDLAGSQLSHFSDLMDNRIRLSGPSVSLGPDAAQAIGMALHELGTNAGKYGALSSDTGHVDVAWEIRPTDGSFEIRWSEFGGPRVAAPEKKGFGSAVIGQMIRSVLGAEVQIDFAPDGVKWRLVCDFSALNRPR